MASEQHGDASLPVADPSALPVRESRANHVAGTPADPAAGKPAPDADPSVIEEYREGLTMAIYIALSLLAVLMAVPFGNHASRAAAAVTVFITAVGLLLAHMVAFSLSAQLFGQDQRDSHLWKVLGSQVSAGLFLAVVTTVPVALLPVDLGVTIDVVLLLVFIALIGYAIARNRGAGFLRSLIYVGLVILVVAVVMAVKLAVHH